MYTNKKEGAIKNGQFRDTGKIGHTRHRTKTNKIKITRQKTKKMSNTCKHTFIPVCRISGLGLGLGLG